MSAVEIIGAIVAGLAPIGGGIVFVWNKIERRFTRIEEQLEECQRREEASRDRRAVQLTVIELLWLELKRVAPDAHVLTRAKSLLDGLKIKQGGEG